MPDHARPRQIREWWIEYKVAAQFSKRWSEVEELSALAKERRGFVAPGVVADLSRVAGTWTQSPANTIGSAHYWMQQVYVPRWFKFDELGIGSGISIYRTLATLDDKNKKRRRRYDEQIKRLEKAQKTGARKTKA